MSSAFKHEYHFLLSQQHFAHEQLVLARVCRALTTRGLGRECLASLGVLQVAMKIVTSILETLQLRPALLRKRFVSLHRVYTICHLLLERWVLFPQSGRMPVSEARMLRFLFILSPLPLPSSPALSSLSLSRSFRHTHVHARVCLELQLRMCLGEYVCLRG